MNTDERRFHDLCSSVNFYLSKMRDLPERVQIICSEVNAPPRLIAHLTLVHDVAVKLVGEIKHTFPELLFDENSVCFGAATHDIGKSIHQSELVEAGNNHELAGEQLLLNLGIDAELARFARTHANWQDDENLIFEDLLVTLADKCWKGKRVEKLESLIAEYIASRTKRETWDVFMLLDDILQKITKDADERLAWQAKFPTSIF